MIDRRRLSGAWVLLALCVAAPNAHALDPGALGFLYSGSGGKAAVGSIVGNAAGRTWSAAADGAVSIAEKGAARIGGASALMTATRTIPWSAVAAAVGKALPLVAAGMLAYDLYGLVNCHSGAGSVTCADTVEVKVVDQFYILDTMFKLPGPACDDYVARAAAPAENYYATYRASGGTTATVGGQLYCLYTLEEVRKPGYGASSSARTSIAISTQPKSICEDGSPLIGGQCQTQTITSPASDAEVQSKIEQSPVAKAQAQTIVQAIAPKIDLAPYADPPVVTGPATVPEPQPQVETHYDPRTGTTTTTTTNTVYNINYAGDTYTYVTNVTTTNPDGTVDTKTTPPAPETPKPEEVAPPTDTALPDVPKLYTPIYPNGFAGVWQTDSAALTTTPMGNFLSSLKPSFSDGGCPVWNLPTTRVLGIQVGGDISIACSVWAFIRVVMIISALLLARAVIFGG